MTIYTTEIDGIVVRIFHEETHQSEMAIRWLYPRLRGIDGRPIWGSESRVHTRKATPEEIALFHRERWAAVDRGLHGELEHGFSCFPYPVKR